MRPLRMQSLALWRCAAGFLMLFPTAVLPTAVLPTASADLRPFARYLVTNCTRYGGPGEGGTLGDAIAQQQAGQIIAAACDGDLKLPAGNGPVIVISTDGVTLSGAGHTVSLDGNGQTQVLLVETGVHFTLDHIKVINGRVVGAGSSTGFGGAAYGAGLYNNGGLVTLTQDTFSNNTAIGGDTSAATYEGGAAEGGAIYSTNGGTLRITGSTFETNSAVGGAGVTPETVDAPAYGGSVASDSGIVQVTRTTFRGNSVESKGGAFAGAVGGALYNNSDGATITDSTFIQNHVSVGDGGSAFGGAIESVAPLTVTGSTFTSNAVSSGPHGRGAGGAIDTNSAATIANSTFDGNAVHIGEDGVGEGGALSIYRDMTVLASTFDSDTISGGQVRGSEIAIGAGATATVGQSVVSGSGPPNCQVSGTLNDTGYNLSSDSSCQLGTSPAQHDIVAVDPKLGRLGPNGGPTDTVGLLPGSPAIDGGPTRCHESVDQRGTRRPQGSRCDIGAFELKAGEVTSPVQTLPAPTTGGANGGVSEDAGIRFAGSRIPLLAVLAVACVALVGGGVLVVTRRRVRSAYRRPAARSSRKYPW